MASSRGSCQPRDQNHISYILRLQLGSLPLVPPGLPRSQFSSVTQSCPTLCNPMDYSTPGLPVHHQIPEFTQTHIHRVSDAIQPSHPLSRPLHLPPSVFPSIRVFSNESVLHTRWSKYWSFSFSISPSTEYSGLISFGWTGWISLLSKGLRKWLNLLAEYHLDSLHLLCLLLPLYFFGKMRLCGHRNSLAIVPANFRR